MTEDIRWLQRFANFEKAYLLLKEVCDRGVASLSQLEQEGAVQRFEGAFELAWKTLRDFLEHSGRIVSPVSPRDVIKEAFAAEVLPDGQVWIDMMMHRNLISHTYDVQAFESLLVTVEERYVGAMGELYGFFNSKKMDQ